MPVDRLPNFKPPVEQLFKLTAEKLSPEEFKLACEEFSRFDKSNSDDDFWNFVVSDEVDTQLSVSIHLGPEPKTSEALQYQPTEVICANLPFCWWETYSRNDHKSEESFLSEREEFDRIFFEELQAAKKAIGEPHLEGAQEEQPFLKYAVWKKKAGFLLLQQSADDPQFGHQISYFIKPCDLERTVPENPSVDWIRKLISTPPNPALPRNWDLCEPGLENELNREIVFNFFHPLRFVRAASVARRSASDDVLFELFGHKHKYAAVHLTWARETIHHWPDTIFYDSWDQWVAATEADELEREELSED